MTDYIKWLENEIKETQDTINKWTALTGRAPVFSTGYMQALQTCLVQAEKCKEQADLDAWGNAFDRGL